MQATRHGRAEERAEAPSDASHGHNVFDATAVDPCVGRPQGMSIGVILQCDVFLSFFGDELEGIQALRAVCRDVVSEATTQVLCYLAFHDSDLVPDPYSDPTLPIWSRCVALYFPGLD